MCVRGEAPVSPTYRPAVTLPPERLRAVDDPGDSPRLVRGERVHRIDEDGLDAGASRPLAAVVEHRIQEALGLAGAGPRRDDGGLAPRQPIEGGALVPVRGEAERRRGERLPAFRGALERQLDGEVRTLEQVVGVGKEFVHHGGRARGSTARSRWRGSPEERRPTSAASVEGIMDARRTSACRHACEPRKSHAAILLRTRDLLAVTRRTPIKPNSRP